MSQALRAATGKASEKIEYGLMLEDVLTQTHAGVKLWQDAMLLLGDRVSA